MNNLQDTKNSQTERPVDCERCNRLEDALKRANGLAEHFERAWYLRGDEIERLTAQPEQEVDWEKLYRLEVKKKDALAAKYERDIKPLTRIVPKAQPEPMRLRRGDILRSIETDELCTVWSTSTTGKTLIKWGANDFCGYTAEQIGELFWLEPSPDDLELSAEKSDNYTTPPQRKPLTDEQIVPMFSQRQKQQTEGEKDEWYFYAWGVSDGEAAHGIKE